MAEHMKRTIANLVLSVGICGLPFVLSACSSDSGSTTSGGKSTSSSTTGTGGMGEGGAGGMGQGGSGGMGQGGAGGGMVACMAGADTCSQCLYAQCQDTFCNCVAEPQCLGIAPCVQKCAMGDDKCVGACYTANSSGFAQFILTADCMSKSCLNPCSNGMMGGGMLSTCQICLAQKCETSLEACVGDAECGAILVCTNKCAAGDKTCQQTCATQHPNGVPKLSALLTCSQQQCSMDCK
jgi:hypothetical protein